jgi:hypothetical protein
MPGESSIFVTRDLQGYSRADSLPGACRGYPEAIYSIAVIVKETIYFHNLSHMFFPALFS